MSVDIIHYEDVQVKNTNSFLSHDEGFINVEAKRMMLSKHILNLIKNKYSGQIQVKIDSNQSDVSSYATNVTAPAGAALTVDGTIPLYRPAQPSDCKIRRRASNIFL